MRSRSPELAMLLAVPLATLLASLPLAACHGPPADAADAPATPAAATSVASAPAATPTPADPPIDPPSDFKAIGTEPFWSASIAGSNLVYSTPDFPAGMRIVVSRKVTAESVEYAGILDGKPLSLTLRAGPCSDGMSDKVYRYSATREIGPDVQRGCAGPK